MRRAGIAVALAAGILLGCAQPQVVGPEGQQLLRQAADAFEQGDSQRSIELADAFIQAYGRGSHSAEAFYIRGLGRFRLEQYEAAAEDLEMAVVLTRVDELKGRAQAELGEIAFAQHRLGQAEAEFRQALRNLPMGRRPGDHAHLRLGQILQRQGRWDEADVQLGHLVHLFPNSPLVTRARELAGSRAWTVQAGAFREKPHADQLARRLQGEGLPVVTQAAMESTGGLQFLVQVGRYPDFSQANQMLPRVQQFAPQAFLNPAR